MKLIGRTTLITAATMMLLASACNRGASNVVGDRVGNPPPKVELTLGTNELEGGVTQLFIDAVTELSGGRIVVKPTWQIAYHDPAWDQAVIAAGMAGTYDLVVARAGAWHDSGVTTLDSLELPGIINSDVQADRVSQSAVADKLLAGLSTINMTGLALYPEGLRHLASSDGRPISAATLNGAKVRAPKSHTVFEVLGALGAEPVDLASPAYDDAVLHDEVPFTDTPIVRLITIPVFNAASPPMLATNFTLYSKFNVLAMTSKAVAALGDDATIVHSAAAAALKATIEQRPREDDTAQQACSDGLQLGLVAQGETETLMKMVEPVIAAVESGPDGELVDQVRKAAGAVDTAPVPRCDPRDVPTSASTEAVSGLPTQRSDVTPEAGDLPNGTYRVTFTAAQLDVVEPDRSPHKQSDGGTLEFYLKDGTYTLRGFDDGKPQSLSPPGVYHVDGDNVIFVLPSDSGVPGTNGINLHRWTFENDILTLTQIDGKPRDGWFAFPWIRVGDAPPS
ncbi:MAG: hypothetical protein ABI862_13020 [Ilumatobacteraceae bacterium]